MASSNLRNGIVEMEVRYGCLRNNTTYSYPIYCIAAQVPAIRAPGLYDTISVENGDKEDKGTVPRSSDTGTSVDTTHPGWVDVVLVLAQGSVAIHDDRVTLRCEAVL